jgi:hypothetical protein
MHTQGKVLEAVSRRYPASHYLMVDDKPRILTTMKDILGNRLTTVFPCQGHYALDPETDAASLCADITLERIGDLMRYDLSALSGGVTAGTVKKEPS